MKNKIRNLLVTIVTAIIVVTAASLLKQYSSSIFLEYQAIFSSYWPLQKALMWCGSLLFIPFVGVYIFQIFTLNTWVFFIMPMFLLALSYRILIKQKMTRIDIIVAALIFTLIGYIPLSYTIYPSFSATISSISKQMSSPNSSIAPIPQFIFIFIICLLSLALSNNLISTFIEKNTFAKLKNNMLLSSFIIVLFTIVFIAPTYKTVNYLSCDPGYISYGDPIKEATTNLNRLASVSGGYINPKGEIVIKTSYRAKKEFSNGFAAVTLDGKKWGFIDTSGNIRIAPSFDTVHDFSEGLAPVEINKKWGFINKEGKFVINPTFDFANSFSEGLAIINEKDKYGYINKSGDIIIQPKYASAGKFSEGLAPVSSDKMQWVFINKSAQTVIKPRLGQIITSFENGLATTQNKKKWVKINTAGKEICGGNNPY